MALKIDDIEGFLNKSYLFFENIKNLFG
jgi:hypothetical protein